MSTKKITERVIDSSVFLKDKNQRATVFVSLLAGFIREQGVTNPEFELIKKVSSTICISTLPYTQYARMSEAVEPYLAAIAQADEKEVIHVSHGELEELSGVGSTLTAENPTHCIMVITNPRQLKSIDDLYKEAKMTNPQVKTPALYIMLEIISHLANDARQTLSTLGVSWLLLGNKSTGRYPVIIIPSNDKVPVTLSYVTTFGQGITGKSPGLVVFAVSK